MSSLNRILLIGTVATEPSIKVTTSGDSVSNFSLSVKRPSRPDGVESQSDQFKVVCWKHVAEKSSQFSLGQLLFVEGRIHSRSFDDQSGVKKYVTEIDAKDIKEFGTEVVSSSPFSVTAIPDQASDVPLVEKMDQDITPFQFDEIDGKNFNTSPSFGQDVDEDIPF